MSWLAYLDLQSTASPGCTNMAVQPVQEKGLSSIFMGSLQGKNFNLAPLVFFHNNHSVWLLFFFFLPAVHLGQQVNLFSLIKAVFTFQHASFAAAGHMSTNSLATHQISSQPKPVKKKNRNLP